MRGVPFRRLPVLVASVLVLLQSSCLIVPVRTASSVEGVVVDEASGKPVPGALVVVRFDGRYDDVLPDREILAHVEIRTDALGRFETGRIFRAGITAYPLFKTDARVVSVLMEGYRCSRPQKVLPDRAVRISLAPALDALDQRDSCRPVPAQAGEAVEYMTAWRALYEPPTDPSMVERDRQIERLLEARAVFGFGENCAGPVLDLSLAPGGARAAFVSNEPIDSGVHVVEMGDGVWSPPERVGSETRWPPRRLAWADAGSLVLWEPASDVRQPGAPEHLGSDPAGLVWSADPANGSNELRGQPLDPADLNDEGDSMWLGRSFSLVRSLDPRTGLSADRLSVTREDGSRYQLPLPGEACGVRGHFGRPHYRIAADGRTALDLRFVEGGCHAVRLDLETGEWALLDRSHSPSVCNAERTVPASHLSVGLRNYVREVSAAVSEAGADPAAAYVFHIDAGGQTRVETRDFAGEPRSVPVPDFPLTTPLRRIDVSVVGSLVSPSTPSPVVPAKPDPSWEPL